MPKKKNKTVVCKNGTKMNKVFKSILYILIFYDTDECNGITSKHFFLKKTFLVCENEMYLKVPLCTFSVSK